MFKRAVQEQARNICAALPHQQDGGYSRSQSADG